MGEGERNYHAFYHLVAGGTADAEALGLGKGAKSFFYLNQSSVDTVAASPNPDPDPTPDPDPDPNPNPNPNPNQVDTVAALPDARMYQELATALGTCGVPAAEQAELHSK